MNIDRIINELDKLIIKAKKHNEVPIAALIVKNNKIISKTYNKVEKNNNVLNHAEILAIIKASKKIKNWRLDNCELYVSLEPCEMCKTIIKKARIKKIYYFTKQNKHNTENDPMYEHIDNNYFSNQLRLFFKNKR